MGQCLHQFLLIYHLLWYHGNTFVQQRSRKIGIKLHKNPSSLSNSVFGKIDIKYEISVSELTPPPNLSLIRPKIEKLVKSRTLNPKSKNDVNIGKQR